MSEQPPGGQRRWLRKRMRALWVSYAKSVTKGNEKSQHDGHAPKRGMRRVCIVVRGSSTRRRQAPGASQRGKRGCDNVQEKGKEWLNIRVREGIQRLGGELTTPPAVGGGIALPHSREKSASYGRRFFRDRTRRNVGEGRSRSRQFGPEAVARERRVALSRAAERGEPGAIVRHQPTMASAMRVASPRARDASRPRRKGSTAPPAC